MNFIVNLLMSVLGGWTPLQSDMQARTSWIQADLITVHLLISVTTQGRSDDDIWTTSYYISYGNDVSNLIDISTLYSGNFDRNTKVTNQLPSNTVGRYIRLRPNDYYQYVGVRWDVLGVPGTEPIRVTKRKYTRMCFRSDS